MIVFCDGSYSKNGKSAVGLVCIQGNVITGRDAFVISAKSSQDAEIQALKAGILWATKTNAVSVNSDDKQLVALWKTTRCLAGLSRIFTGVVRWVPRNRNTLADGMARMAAAGIDWREIRKRSKKIEVINSNVPMTWVSGDNIVSLRSHKFHCNCSKYKTLSHYHYHCEHIQAVMRKINMINDVGEGIL